MKKIILLFSLLFLANASPINAQNLLVMGDSLSAAYNLRQQDGWVSLMSAKLSQSHPNVNIVNASVSGETTQGGAARFPNLLRTHQPNWVILELGANDGLRGYPLDIAKDNLKQMINAASRQGAEVLLVGNHLPPNYGRRYTEQFFNMFKELATETGVAYYPFMLENVALDPSLMLSDGLHPNAEGQKKVLENLYPAVIELLQP